MTEWQKRLSKFAGTTSKGQRRLPSYNFCHHAPSQFLYGATWNANRKSLYNWRDEVAGNYEDLVKAFVAPERVLRVISDFIVFSDIDGELNKFVLRPHQMRAADRVVERAKDPAKRRALVWHTQGSGKTYTMITAAKLLIDDHGARAPDGPCPCRPNRA